MTGEIRQALEGAMRRLSAPLDDQDQSDAAIVYRQVAAALAAPPTPRGEEEPIAWVNPEQFANLTDCDDDSGDYLPVRKSRVGKFTMPFYATPRAEIGDEARAREIYAQTVEQFGGDARYSIAQDIRNDTDNEWYPTVIRAMLSFAAATPAPVVGDGWIVGSGDCKRWRCWTDGMSDWTTDRNQATRYARRKDAEAVHREDEDAWTVTRFTHVAADGLSDIEDWQRPDARELGMLYNYAHDDSRQFTRWQMMEAIAHGRRIATTPASVSPDAGEELAAFSRHTNWELSHYSQTFSEDDDYGHKWQVHKVNGGINDREWTLIGSGETAAEAIRAALTAASHAEKPE